MAEVEGELMDVTLFPQVKPSSHLEYTQSKERYKALVERQTLAPETAEKQIRRKKRNELERNTGSSAFVDWSMWVGVLGGSE